MIWSFLNTDRQNQINFIEAVPSRCARYLREAEAEVALIPVIEYQRIPGGYIVPDVCVGSKQEVLSVVLVSKNTELQQIHTIALDESSRTSATLVKIIFREFLQTEPEWATCSPNLAEMLEQNDAALIIGDPGMTFPREGLKVWDMASLWRDHTDLGFVFAMWMVREDAQEKAGTIDFASVRDEGVAHIEEIVQEYKNRIPMSVEALRRYLTENIVFAIDDSMRRGLNLYFELAHKHGLIDELKPLRFLR